MMGTFIVKAAIQSLSEKRKMPHIVPPFNWSPQPDYRIRLY